MPRETPLPSWLVIAERELDDHLHAGRLVPVAIRIEPADGATFGVSSFAPDEVFSPRIVHLPVGRYVITATAPGRARVQTAIDVTAGKPREAVLRFGGADRSRVPWIVAGTGAALLIAGGIYHAAELAPVRATLAGARDPVTYDRNSATFDRRREITLGLYAVGAAAAITGVVLHYTMFRDRRESPVQVTGALADHGAIMGSRGGDDAEVAHEMPPASCTARPARNIRRRAGVPDRRHARSSRLDRARSIR